MPQMHFKPKEQRHNGREYHTHDPLEQITRPRGRAEDQVKSMQLPPDFLIMLQNQWKTVFLKLNIGFLILSDFLPLLTIILSALATEGYPLINTEY